VIPRSCVPQVGGVAVPGPELRAECAGIIARSWFASGVQLLGHELIAARLLITCGPLDNDALTEWVAEGQRRAKTCWTASDF
jgi:hypothetical protein